jgi:hypothetical protein
MPAAVTVENEVALSFLHLGCTQNCLVEGYPRKVYTLFT